MRPTSELRRILDLPRRTWSPTSATSLAEELGPLLGRGQLRPIQAVALVELAQTGGLFAPIRVGGGKTLISLLAARMVDSKRPLLLIPAKLREKTERELRALRDVWDLPEFIRIMSYEWLGQVQAAEALDTFAPDLMVLDECHRAKRPRAAVTRRVMRYLQAHPECRLAAMSGTITTRSIRDYAHLCTRALGEGAPLPRGRSQLENWAIALDNGEGLNALDAFGGSLDQVRRGYQRRLVETVGVVSYDEPFRGVGLDIRPLPLEPPPVVEDALAQLRDRWELPDGSPLCEALELWRHTRELALGFYGRWDPAPPKDWLAARKEWNGACRYILSNNRRNIDSPDQVVRAVLAGLYPEAAAPLATWHAIRDTFEPNPVAVWLHPFAVEAAAAWLDEPGIAWAEHVPFAERVSNLAGVPYFGAEARDQFGTYIEDASGPIVASWHSCNEGINLQHKWSRNLITSPPSNGKIVEQLIGRTHREGQTRDVSVEWVRTCKEHDDAYARALGDARYVEATTGLQQKLMVTNG